MLFLLLLCIELNLDSFTQACRDINESFEDENDEITDDDSVIIAKTACASCDAKFVFRKLSYCKFLLFQNFKKANLRVWLYQEQEMQHLPCVLAH